MEMVFGLREVNCSHRTGLVGIFTGSLRVTYTAFDVLSLEAIVLVPRCVSPARYFGNLGH